VAFENKLFDLSGMTAVVTGASRGIGEAIARRLAQPGANVVVSSRKIDACEDVATSINADAGRDAARATACNIARKEDLEKLIEFTVAEFGGVDILVSNAAVNPYFGPAAGISDDQFDKIMSCNVKASHWLSQMAVPHMKARGGGSMIIISSVGAFVGSASIGAYNISKAADIQLARNLAVEYGPNNIRANCICPGVVKTYFAEALWKDPKMEALMTKQLPLRRFGEPDDIAGAAVFLASPAGAWMTGQSMIIDGGTVIGLGGL
jgi:NAD(P)-dependent dehydrogenase (short-subunit alcohol dehydrogenase family)